MTYRSRILCGAVKAYHRDYEDDPSSSRSGPSGLFILSSDGVLRTDLYIAGVVQRLLTARQHIISLDKANKRLKLLIN